MISSKKNHVEYILCHCCDEKADRFLTFVDRAGYGSQSIKLCFKCVEKLKLVLGMGANSEQS